MTPPRIFPMLDGPSIPWTMAQIIHEAALVVNPSRLGLQTVQNSGGYRYADIPRMFAMLRTRDKVLYRKLMDRSREFAMATGHLELAPVANVPLSAPPPNVPVEELGPLVVVCWKWRVPGYRVKYEAHHVNVLANMVKRHYNGDYRFVCICDDAKGINTKEVEIVPLWSDYAGVHNPNGVHLPSCFRRLKLFSSAMTDILKARRVVSLDLDIVITGNVTHLWNRPETFVGWRVPSASRTRYAFNGSMWLTVPGAHAEVWDKFDPVRSPQLAKAAQYFGSDQGWMSYYFRDMDMPGWTALDGVYSFPREIRAFGRLPVNANVVIFHGGRKPWEKAALRGHAWVDQHYR